MIMNRMQDHNIDKDLKMLIWKYLDRHYPISIFNEVDMSFDSLPYRLIKGTFDVDGRITFLSWLCERVGDDKYFTLKYEGGATTGGNTGDYAHITYNTD